MRIRNVLIVLSLFLFVQSAPASDLECSMATFYALDKELPTSVDPSLRKWLVECFTETRLAVLKDIDAAKLAEAAGDKPGEPKTAAEKTAARLKEERSILLGRLEALLLSDLPRVETNITALEKIGRSAELDHARESRDLLLPVVQKIDGTVKVVNTIVAQEIAKAEEARKKAQAKKELEQARGNCLEDPNLHLHVDEKSDTITRCIEALTAALENGQQLPAKITNAQRAVVKAEEAKQDASVEEGSKKKDLTDKDAAEKAARKKELAVNVDVTATAEAKAAAVKAREQAEKELKSAADAHVQAIKDVESATEAVKKAKAEVKSLDEQNTRARENKKFWSLQLARFEEAGRRLATVQGEELADLKAKHDSLEGDAKKNNDEEQKAAEEEIDKLGKFVAIPNEDPITEYADYEQWFNKFFIGYEYSTISEAFSKGFPRMGATIGFHYPRQSAPEASANWRSYGLWNTFTVALTNTAEASDTSLTDLGTPFVSRRIATSQADPEQPADNEPNPPKLERAVEFESQFFWAFWRSDLQRLNRRLRTRIGPILVAGARKADSDTFSHHRVYFGLRSARSPETFWDLMVGKTGGLRSRRLELRGQYALPRIFANGARLVVGGTGNFGVNKRRHGTCEENDTACVPDETDSIRFFISYDISGEGILGRFLPKKK